MSGYWEAWLESTQRAMKPPPSIGLDRAFGVYWGQWRSMLVEKLLQTDRKTGKELWIYADTEHALLENGEGFMSPRALLRPPPQGANVFPLLIQMGENVDKKILETKAQIADMTFWEAKARESSMASLDDLNNEQRAWTERMIRYMEISATEFANVSSEDVGWSRYRFPEWWRDVVDPMFFGKYPPDTTAPETLTESGIPDVVGPIAIAYTLEKLKRFIEGQPYSATLGIHTWSPLEQTSDVFEKIVANIDEMVRETLKLQGEIAVPEPEGISLGGLVVAGLAVGVAAYAAGAFARSSES